MTKLGNRRWLIILVACGLAVSACGNDKDDGKDAKALTADDTILRFVPANSPYVFANVTPLPDALYDKFEPKIDAVLKAYQAVMREAIKSKADEMPEDAGDEEEVLRLASMVNELSSLFSVSGIREAGIGRDATFAMYGNGLLPVIRIQLTDGEAFEAAIARIEEEAGEQLQVAELGGKSYRYLDADDVRIVIAVFDDQAVFTVAPAEFDEKKLSQLVGLTLPPQSIAASGELQEIAKEYGFTSHYLGFISTERLANTFLDSPDGLDADLIAMMNDGDAPGMEISDVCKSEIRSLVGVIPRMVLGYTRIDAERLDSSAIIELREDIALGLSGLPGAVPGLGTDHGGLFSFGFGLNPKAVREFYEARLDAMEADPYECDLLQDLQAGAAEGRKALNQPVPPMVYDFRGLLAIVDDIEGLDLASSTPPKSISARILLAMDNVQTLVAMGSMFIPQVAELNLQPDGKAVPLDLPQTNGIVENPFIAMTDSALVISVGDDAEAKIASMLGGPIDERPPFMSVAIDAKRYYSFVRDAMAAGNDGDKAPPVAVREAMQDAMQAVSSMYERMVMDIRFTSRGVEMDGTVTVAD